MNSEFKAYLENYSKYVTDKILKFVSRAKFSDASILEAIKYVLNVGGKRLRPIFVLEIAKILDVDIKQAVNVAISIELMHCYSLVHDDLPAMDNDDMRRGSLTCHKKFDVATAILVGDALQCLSFQILSEKETHPCSAVRCNLINELCKSAGVTGMVEGQMLDLEASSKDLNFRDIKKLQRLKTGELFRFSCISAPILAKKEKEFYELFEKYSFNLGIAFQIKDDLLDFEGEESKVGKKINKDKLQGKKTFISFLGVKKAKQMAKDLIDESIDLISSFGSKSNNLTKITKLIIERNY